MAAKLWTDQEDLTMEQLFPKVRTIEVALLLKRSYSSVVYRAKQLGLEKSEMFKKSLASGRKNVLSEASIASRFKPGIIPWNKGQKMSKSTYEKCSKSMFKKGQIPGNALTDGAITIRDGYKHIRISKNVWKLYQRYIWEQHNGPIKGGCAIVFKDNNPMNCDISNLELVTRKQLMNRNTIHRYPEEIKKTIRVLTKVKKTIRKHEEQNGRS